MMPQLEWGEPCAVCGTRPLLTEPYFNYKRVAFCSFNCWKQYVTAETPNPPAAALVSGGSVCSTLDRQSRCRVERVLGRRGED